MIAYRALLDVPRDLVRFVSRLLAGEQRVRGTRRRTRALTCGKQALFVLVWFRKREDLAVLGAGSGISRASKPRRAARCWPPARRSCPTPSSGSPPTAGRT